MLRRWRISKKFDPNQPRVPKGMPGAGRWGSGVSLKDAAAAALNQRAADPTNPKSRLRAKRKRIAAAKHFAKDIYEVEGANGNWSSVVDNVEIMYGSGATDVQLYVVGHISGRHDEYLGSFDRMLHLKSGLVDHRSMKMQGQQNRGHGVGGEFVTRSMANAKAAGFTTVETEAYSDGTPEWNGLVIWPRLGFEIKDGVKVEETTSSMRMPSNALMRAHRRLKKVMQADGDFFQKPITAEHIRRYPEVFKGLGLGATMTFDLQNMPIPKKVAKAVTMSMDEWMSIISEWVEPLDDTVAKKFNPSQPRIPRGMPGAGRWLGRRRWGKGDPEKHYDWKQPDNWIIPGPDGGLIGARRPTGSELDPIEPSEPTTFYFDRAIGTWKGDPGEVMNRMDDVLAGNGVPAWRVPDGGGESEYTIRRKYAAAIVNAVAQAPVVDYPLTRGMVLRQGDPILSLREGDTFDWKPSGFTRDRGISIPYAIPNADTPYSRTEGVHITLRPGAHALDIDSLNLGGMSGEQEHIVAGRFRVIKAEFDEDGILDLDIEQVVPLGMPDDGGIWKTSWNWTDGPGPMAISRPKEKPPKIEQVLANQYLAGFKDGMADPLVNVSKAEVDPDDILAEAQDYARQQAGNLIVGVKNTRIIQSIISRSIAEDWPEARLQAAIGRSVGLDPRSQTALNNYEKGLIQRGTPPGTTRRLTKAYSDTLKARRVKTIANNERASAYAEGKRAVWRRMKSMGEVSPYAVRVWRTHKDERTCEVCGPLNGRRASIDDERGYRIGAADRPTGFTPGPPAHVNCRCWEELDDKGTPEIP